jgi:biofilm PGA synthesis N-glycosyltransferase PgaC
LIWLAIFGICLFATFYVLVGYPLLLSVLARGTGRPVRPRLEFKTVTVLLPVHNGAPWLKAKLESILGLKYPRELMQILVISDASTDETDAIALDYRNRGVELLRIAKGGKALALNAGMERATGEILFFTDVRQRLQPEALERLVAYLGDPEVGVVSGELVILKGESEEEANTSLYWKYEKWLRKRMSHLGSVPGATGCIFAMHKRLARPMPPNTLLDDVFEPMAAYFAGYRVIWTEDAKAYDYPTKLSTEYPRKVRTQAGIYQIIRWFPQVLSPFHNGIWLHFMSHRFGRLMLPFLLIGILVGSFGLPWPFSALALIGQACFYGLALIDPLVPDGSTLKKLTSVTRTFVVLVLAALSASSIVFRPNKQFWSVTRIGEKRG